MEQISSRQFFALVFLLRIGLTIVRLPTLKLMPEGPDGWISVLVGTTVGTALVTGIFTLAARHPDRTPQQLLDHALGKVVGRFVGACYLLFFLWDALFSLRLYSGMLVALPMPETPAEAFIIMMLVGTTFGALQGREVVLRMAEFVLPVLVGGILIVLLLGVNHMDQHALKPVLAHGWPPILRTAIFSSGVHGDTLAALMVLHSAQEPRKAARAGALGALCSGLLTAVCAVALIMFYSSPETRRLVYPLYDLARSITVGEFFERLDALFIFIWTAGSFVKIAYLQWAIAAALQQLLGLKQGRSLLLPLGLLLGVAASRTYDTQAEVYLLNAPPVYLLLTAPFLVILPLLTAGGGLVRRWGRGSA